MAFHSRLRWQIGILVMTALSLVFVLSSAALAFTPHAKMLILVSSDPYTNKSSQHKTEVEPDTYAYGSTIVSTFQVGRFKTGGSSNIGWATSQDGGKTWKRGFLPSTTIYATPPGPFPRISDPAVVYDARYKIWMISTLGIGNTNLAVLTSLSKDGGLTWSKPVTVHTGNDDKNWITCDDSSSSPFYGYCYTEWDIGVNNQHFNEVSMSTSSDGGKTWSAAITPAGTPNGIAGLPLVQPGGRVIVPILGEPTQNSAEIDAYISDNGGKSWSHIYKVTPVTSATDGGGIRSGPLPSAEIDASGKVYVTWEDCRFEKGCSANDIVMSTSSDGKTWSKVQRIPIDPIGSGVDHFLPGIGVDSNTKGDNAHLALTYYYYPIARCNFNTCSLNIGYVSSTDGGAHWSTKVQVAGPMKLSWLAQAGGAFVGDYIGTAITSDGEAFTVFAVAHAPHNGVFDEAMYTTPQSVQPVVGGTIPSSSDGVVVTLETTSVPHTRN